MRGPFAMFRRGEPLGAAAVHVLTLMTIRSTTKSTKVTKDTKKVFLCVLRDALFFVIPW